MMLDRMFVSDIQKEIMDMQIDLSVSTAATTTSSSTVTTTSSAVVGSTSTTFARKDVCPITQQNYSDVKPTQLQLYQHHVQFHKDTNTDIVIKNEIKTEIDFKPRNMDLPSMTLHHHPQPLNKAFASVPNNRSLHHPSRFLTKGELKPLFVATPFDSRSGALEVPIKSINNNNNQNSVHSPKMTNENVISSYVKKECDNFDIETEITPSFIMKKCELSSNAHRTSPITSEFPIDYLCSPTEVTVKKKEEEVETSSTSTKEPYDEWLCIQKELSIMTDKTEPAESPTGRTVSPVFPPQERSSMFLQTITDRNSPKNEVDLRDLFAPSSHSLHLKSDLNASQNSPLSELFNTDNIQTAHNNHHHHHHLALNNKSVETRLEAMFGDGSDLEKSNDLVESRLDALFHGSPSTPSPIDDHHQDMLPASPDWMHHAPHQHSVGQLSTNHLNNKRGFNDLMSVNSPSPASPSLFSSAKRSCMVSSFIEEHGSRWMMDVQNSYDFTGNTTQQTANEMLKRPWNGVGGSSSVDMHLEQPKKMCFNSIGGKSTGNHHDIIDRDLLGMSAGSPSGHHQHQLDQNAMMHLHADNAFDVLHGLGGSGVGGIGPNHHNHNSNSMSNFDNDDINRHVQNAIDSILNLNSETDSLHFSLDHTMSSFLADSPLGALGGNGSSGASGTGIGGSAGGLTAPGSNHLLHHHHHHHHMATAAVNASPLASSRPHHHLKRRMHNRLDDISDCLISGGGSGGDSNGAGMMMGSPSTDAATSSVGGVGVSDFNIAGGIDEAIKSIITS